MSKTAIIYARVSTTKQADEELPVESQIAQCRKKAEELGAEVVKVYRDDGLSGRSDTRPAFRSAIDYASVYSPTYLITWSSSRFARNKVDAGVYKASLAKAGTQLVYVSMNVDTSTNEGWLIDGVMELFDELYSRQVSADTLRSMVKNASEGYWNGGRPPLGYAPVPDADNPKRKRLQVVEHEAIIVREMFDLRSNGQGAMAIATLLNEKGSTNRGHRWNKGTVASLLRNPTVNGCMVFGRRGSDRRARAKEDWMVVKSHPAIINDDLWITVQRAMDVEVVVADNGSSKSSFLFTGLLRCSVCGSSMQIETAKGRSRRYEYYNCRRAQQHGDCENRRISARELDDWLVEHMASEIFNKQNLRSILEEMNKACSTWAIEQRKKRATITARLKEVNGKNSKLFDVLELYGKDAPNLGDLTKKLRANNDEIKRLESELLELDGKSAPEITVSMDDIQELSDTLIEIIKTTKNPKKIRHFFGSFISAIHMEADHVRVEYHPHVLIHEPRLVHSKVGWLPEHDLLGTAIIRFALPDIFIKKTA